MLSSFRFASYWLSYSINTCCHSQTREQSVSCGSRSWKIVSFIGKHLVLFLMDPLFDVCSLILQLEQTVSHREPACRWGNKEKNWGPGNAEGCWASRRLPSRDGEGNAAAGGRGPTSYGQHYGPRNGAKNESAHRGVWSQGGEIWLRCRNAVEIQLAVLRCFLSNTYQYTGNVWVKKPSCKGLSLLSLALILFKSTNHLCGGQKFFHGRHGCLSCSLEINIPSNSFVV